MIGSLEMAPGFFGCQTVKGRIKYKYGTKD
jgi:hypothetical protein